jgi:hypothetical protein
LELLFAVIINFLNHKIRAHKIWAIFQGGWLVRDQHGNSHAGADFVFEATQHQRTARGVMSNNFSN